LLGEGKGKQYASTTRTSQSLLLVRHITVREMRTVRQAENSAIAPSEFHSRPALGRKVEADALREHRLASIGRWT
jgi:hypothetical protein